MEHFLHVFCKVQQQYWDAPALTNYQGESFTHAEVATEIAKLHLIFKETGIKPGDKIAIAAKNSARWGIAFLAIVTYHAVAVPILYEFTPDNIKKLVNHSDSKLLFTDRKTWNNIQAEGIDQLQGVFQIDDYNLLYYANPNLLLTVENVNILYSQHYPQGLQREQVDYLQCDLDELAVINYTSGTTGTPKGIMLTARSISSNVTYGMEQVPNRPGEHILCVLPLAHMFGLAFEFLYTLCCGCHIYFLAKAPTPSTLLQALGQVKPCLFVTVPLVMEKMMRNKVMPALRKPAIRYLLRIPFLRQYILRLTGKKIMQMLGGNVREMPMGGAALNPEVERLMHEMRIPFTVGYGMTECGPLVGFAKWYDFKLKSCGRAVDRMEVRIDSKDACRMAGEIQLRGDNVMQGYYKNPEATRAAFTSDGWLKTGDLGIIDKSGNIYIKGRCKCMILSSNGQNIYPEEIESQLNNMPNVGESLVVERNKKLTAIITLLTETTASTKLDETKIAEDIRTKLNKALPVYSQIAKVEILHEGFVHTPKHSIKRCLYE